MLAQIIQYNLKCLHLMISNVCRSEQFINMKYFKQILISIVSEILRKIGVKIIIIIKKYKSKYRKLNMLILAARRCPF